MRRLGGYLKRAPKVLAADQLAHAFLQRCDGYFVRVQVSKVGKRRQFPVASVAGEGVSRSWVVPQVCKSGFL